jgi:UDP-N-acetylmuramyl pentapeptide phosphotransferase/UDP-N-acetylglucosamine-1-phosphate transferase
MAMKNFCPDCSIVRENCLEYLSPRQHLLLTGHSVDVPVMRIPRGILTFESTDPELAIQTCRDSARQSGGDAECAPPNPATLALALAEASHTQIEFNPSLPTLTKITVFAGLASFFICALIVWSERWHSRFSHDEVKSGPQKFHAIAVPRIGGLAIACSICATLIGLAAVDLLENDTVHGFAMLALAASPAFFGGLAEDLTKSVGVLARLMLTMAAGVLASVLIGATLRRLDVMGLDYLLQYWPLFGIAFTAFAVAGIANAINIIDGYNGLTATYSIMALSAFTWVSIQVGDHVVLLASLTMLGAMLGFLLWNWPWGKIFLGDGGAYLLGFWLAELGVLLVVRNPQVSPWFPLTILFYPVWETLFSIYRRKFLRKHQIAHPDALHLHQLVYHRMTKPPSGIKDSAELRRRNNAVSTHLLPPIALLMLPALFFWRSTLALLACSTVFGLVYVWIYSRILHGRLAKPAVET